MDKKFLWGVVNIGQQTEGVGDKNFAVPGESNWERWARRGLVPEIGVANNYWRDYKNDHALVEGVSCNSVRITIEWARIEPREGVFDQRAVAHYRELLLDLRQRNISVVVGLWHWSVPMWFEEKYGMHHRECPALFARFAKFVRDELGDLIDYVVVFNEPLVYLWTSYLSGSRPPFYKNAWWRAWRVSRNLVKIHRQTYVLWKEKFPKTPIGSTYLWNHDTGRDNSWLQRIVLSGKYFWQDFYFLRSLKKYGDFIGVNYYTSNSYFFGKSGGRFGWHGTNDWHSPDLWRAFPKGLYFVLKKVAGFNKPILILENGKPTNPGVDDVSRQKFLKMSVGYMKKAMAEGVDVRGYFYYSLCDSYEWDSGYDFKFGLVEVDRQTGEQIPRESCAVYREIIKSGV